MSWPAAAAALIALAVIAYLGLALRYRRLSHDRLAERLERLKPGRADPDQVNDLLRQIYGLIHAGITRNNPAAAYRAIDLLKTAFGTAVIRADEPPRLTAVVIQALRARDVDTATAALDAFRQMLRRLPPEGVAAAIEQLGFIAAVTLRDKQSFLAAKAADIILSSLERPDFTSDPANTAAAVRTLRLIGVLALRRHETDLFREMTTRLAAVVAARPDSPGLSGEIVALTAQWLHRIVKNDDQVMFGLLADMASALPMDDPLIAEDIQALIKEWQELAGTSCLNPHSSLAEGIISFTLELALARGAHGGWQQAVTGAGQVARLAIIRHGVKAAVPRLLPLLSAGRELLALELKFGDPENEGSFRQQALYFLVRECVALAEFAARQDLVSTAGDTIADVCRYWTEYSIHSSPKAVKRFCQLLLAYWMKTSRQAKKVSISEELARPVLLSESDKQRLGFMYELFSGTGGQV
ncbi:MAG: hypothetical protein P4N41_20985 [Negativicutes bacterium]|nr:hypothetical protein [Negativicutes bacterium]